VIPRPSTEPVSPELLAQLQTHLPRTPLVTTTQTFQADVIEASQHQPVILEFWAAWCGPCKALTPRLGNALSTKASVQWVRIDVDKVTENIIKAGSLPTLVSVMNGRAADRLAGQIDEAKLDGFIQAIEDTFVPTGSNRLRIDFDMC